jgi:hypothetical protein
MFVLLDFLLTLAFFAGLFWAFWPRYRFVAASVGPTKLYTLSIERYRKVGARPKLLVYQGHGGPWFSALPSNDGEKADVVMNARLDNFLEFAVETNQLTVEANPAEDTSCEAASCGC